MAEDELQSPVQLGEVWGAGCPQSSGPLSPAACSLCWSLWKGPWLGVSRCPQNPECRVLLWSQAVRSVCLLSLGVLPLTCPSHTGYETPRNAVGAKVREHFCNVGKSRHSDVGYLGAAPASETIL